MDVSVTYKTELELTGVFSPPIQVSCRIKSRATVCHFVVATILLPDRHVLVTASTILNLLIRQYEMINYTNLQYICEALKRLQKRQYYRTVSHENWVLYSELIIKIKL